MKTLVDFVIEMPADATLAQEAKETILAASSINEVQQWFAAKGYAVSEQECVRLIENKMKLEQTIVKAGY